MKDGYVLITGATSGLGLAFAKTFSKNGYNTILLARDEKKLKNISKQLKSQFKVNSIFYSCDMQNLDAIKDCYSNIKSKNISINILINNVGISNFGKFKETPLTDEIKIVNTNILSSISITKLLLPELIKNTDSKILNVSSLVGEYPLPYQSVYAATKAFIISFSHAISAELKEDNIQVSVLLPGNMKTDFIERSCLRRLYNQIKVDEMEPIEVASEAFTQFMKGQIVIYPTKRLKKISQYIKYKNPIKISINQYLRRTKALNK